jgi:anaerobic magnesium-protoporphyrin IX monomethyl ester cyclase
MKRPTVTFAYLHSSEILSFGIMYLSAVLKKHGFTVRLILARNANDFIRQFARNPSDIAAFSVTSGLHGPYLSWAKRLKSLGKVHTVFGGPHPTYFPDFIREEPVDAVCIGEGEESFPQYLDLFSEEMAPPRRPVDGWRHKSGGGILEGGLRAPVENIDTLPTPDWELFFRENPSMAHHDVKGFLATRGCPYRCTYCFNREWNARYRGKARVIRVRDPEQVTEEINEVRRRWGLSMVWFLDSNLACNRKWLKAFLPVYKRKVGLPFFCKIRPNVASDELAEELVDAGLISVGIGIESGNERMRNEVLERGISENQILSACHAFKSRRVLVKTYNMLGLPGETYDMAKETLMLNVRAHVDYALTMLLQPFPGTEIARRSEAMGLFDGNFDSLSSSYFYSTPFRFGSPREKRRIVNLQRLFALAVDFPEVRRLVDLLVELPENRFYVHLFRKYNEIAFYRKFYNPRVALSLTGRSGRGTFYSWQ